MMRLLLFACFALAAILLFQSNVFATGYQTQATTRVAQDDSGNTQTTSDPAASPDTGNGDDSNAPSKDPD